MRSPPEAVGPQSCSSPLALAFAHRIFAECQGAARGASASPGPLQRHHAAATAVLAAAARCVAAASARAEVLGAHCKSQDDTPRLSLLFLPENPFFPLVQGSRSRWSGDRQQVGPGESHGMRVQGPQLLRR